MTRHPNYDGNGRQRCAHGCGYWSIAGMVRGQGLCPFHWARWAFGVNWARKCYPDWRPR